MPRGEEWYYIGTADAVEIMAENAAGELAAMLTRAKQRRELAVTSRARGPCEGQDPYAEAVAFWRHWADDWE
jgi:hypothetical protein